MNDQLSKIIKEHGVWMESQKRKFLTKGEFFSIRVNAIAGEDVYHHNYVKLVIEDDIIVAYNDHMHNGKFECLASEEPRLDERNIAVKHKGEHVIVYIHIYVDNFIKNIDKFREIEGAR